MDFEEVLDELVRALPESMGLVLCDFEGETVSSRVGNADFTAAALESAHEHVPRNLSMTMSVPEFLLRLGAAEPGSLFARIQQAHSNARGPATSSPYLLHLGFREVHLVSVRLPEDYYLVGFFRSPCLQGVIHRAFCRAFAELAPIFA